MQFGGGFTGTAATGAAAPFSFGLAKTTAPALGTLTSTPSTGFSFGLNKTTASTGLLATPAATSNAPIFGGFGATTTTTSGFGSQPATSTASLGQGFSFGKPATSTAAPTGFGTSLLGSTPVSSSSSSSGLGAGLGGGLFGTANTATSTSAGSSIFSALPTTSTITGLGGVDPNTALKSGSSSGSGAASDGKTLKESLLPELLTATVEPLLKYVKEEKAVREDIARMSSKPMMKVQEDVTALRQLLSVVANGLQRNACSVEKLKQEMTQKLKNAEMAQRTKDIPAGLQYENTAPIEYFQHLVEDFEDRMVMYRQQIETLDNHLAALHQPSSHTPSEVLSLLKKLHETFISLASQLQQVHETVKSQKEHFLTYRRVFHGDSKNIFYKPTPALKVAKRSQLSDLAGPNPFPGTTNAAAHAMALVHTRAQQPQGPPITSLVGGSQTALISPYGTGLFGATKPSAATLKLTRTQN
ncbi:nucleoporin p58/p45-like isoform X2 [Physella acuta]|uniref:nucleoporin p58/p45-like isoform X2 n=1 Tax=Physella acuta TaxID=109671 RepID=UPI0027DE324A|nr:nucleoporin p58/p45-like isoform X2 [Physella acuta]